MTSNNQLSVGNGDMVDSNVLPPIIHGSDCTNELPEGKSTFQYTSSGHQMWMKADLSEGFAFFRIDYSVIKSSMFCSKILD